MCFRNCWYAAIFKSQANNPKIKTGETVSRFELNSSVKQPFRGESLLENQKINWEGLILDQKIEISELQPRINLLFNRLCALGSEPNFRRLCRQNNMLTAFQQGKMGAQLDWLAPRSCVVVNS